MKNEWRRRMNCEWISMKKKVNKKPLHKTKIWLRWFLAFHSVCVHVCVCACVKSFLISSAILQNFEKNLAKILLWKCKLRVNDSSSMAEANSLQLHYITGSDNLIINCWQHTQWVACVILVRQNYLRSTHQIYISTTKMLPPVVSEVVQNCAKQFLPSILCVFTFVPGNIS
jgi:hypothetical protein